MVVGITRAEKVVFVGELTLDRFLVIQGGE